MHLSGELLKAKSVHAYRGARALEGTPLLIHDSFPRFELDYITSLNSLDDTDAANLKAIWNHAS